MSEAPGEATEKAADEATEPPPGPAVPGHQDADWLRLDPRTVLVREIGRAHV